MVIKYHTAPGYAPVPCLAAAAGACRICALIDRESPTYSEPMRQLFHPEDFPGYVPPAAPVPVATSMAEPVAPAIPLAGDLVAAMAAKLGADRFARYVAGKLGVDCGCERRRLALNKLDQSIRKFLGK